MFYRTRGKRAIDVVVGGTALAVSLPLQAALAVVIRYRLGSPVLFRQERPGRDAEPFEMIKFRTMTDERGPDGELLPDEDRLTPFGHFLRSTSLDELPELFNVVKGDMSLVGPRPLLMRYLSRYSEHQHRRHEVRPGVTGLAQVSGRNALTWEDKFDLDITYVDSMSFSLDLQILVKTLLSVIRRADIAHAGHATAPEFGLHHGEQQVA